jgi:small conductance mechanosensitive channel
MPTRRIDMIFEIGYDDDVEKAQQILERIVSENEKVLKDPAPVIHLHELADSSVNFICRPWVATSDFWDVHWSITKRVKAEFDAAGISIPYPQQDIHVHHVGTDHPA